MAETAHSISIWQPQTVDGSLCFVRPQRLPFGDHYAARRRFDADKGGRRRICFFGESVAAGYLYAPHISPAQLLESYLNGADVAEQYEVIDLARTNEQLATLVMTVERSLQLDPDVLVIFAGNNWNLLETTEVSPYAPAVDDRREYGAALAAGGVVGPIEMGARRRLQRAAAAFARIARLADERQIGVVVVVPEVNLADWHSRQPVLWRPGLAPQAWYQLLQIVQRQLHAAAFAAAAQTAEAMIAHDNSTCPTSYELLGRAYAGMGDRQEAQTAWRYEVDSDQYATLCFMSAPRATRMEQQFVRRAGRAHRFTVVDFAEIVAEQMGGEPPGRALFLDYCHLTLAGMGLAAAALTAAILRLFGIDDDRGDWRRLVAQLPPPQVAAGADAAAKLGAAIHTAHRMPASQLRDELLVYWCREALAASAGVRDTMLDVVQARLAQTPAVLTRAQQRNLQRDFPLTLQHGWRYQHVDGSLLLAIRQVLAADAVATAAIDDWLRRPRTVAGGIQSLLDRFALWEPLEQTYADLIAHPEHSGHLQQRLFWPTSDYCLIAPPQQAATLDITARACHLGAGSAPLPLLLNGEPVAQLRVTGSWRRQRVRLTAAQLAGGLNRLTLQWPAPAQFGDAALLAAATQLQNGGSADLHPVFGELCRLDLLLAG